MARVVGIRFKRAGKSYKFDATDLELSPGDIVIVEVEKGIGMARVVLGPVEMDAKQIDRKLKKVVRKADAVDIERDGFNREREDEAFKVCQGKIAKYGLPMKLVSVEYLFDSSKAIFYFTSDTRVDFRELVKDLAGRFYTRIEMRQIGVRDEAKTIGGLGPCGRELCCSSFLVDFTPVTVRMAKEQNLALNPLKISGVCGRLMCCLSYEVGSKPCRDRNRGKKTDCGKGRDRVAGKGGCGDRNNAKRDQTNQGQVKQDQARQGQAKQGRTDHQGQGDRQGQAKQDRPDRQGQGDRQGKTRSGRNERTPGRTEGGKQ